MSSAARHTLLGLWITLITFVVPAPALAASPDDRWIDGDGIRFMFENEEPQTMPVATDFALRQLKGFLVHRERDRVDVAVHFFTAFDVQLKDHETAANNDVYAVHFPRVFWFTAMMRRGDLIFYGMDKGSDQLTIKMKLKFLPDSVYLRRFTVNLADGKLELEAGLLGNFLTMIASGDLGGPRPIGLDTWDSILSNLDLVLIPLFMVLDGRSLEVN